VHAGDQGNEPGAVEGTRSGALDFPPPPAVDTHPIHSLSPREREILALIAKGASNKELARDLNIAEATVKIHVQHILRKLNLSSRVQAAVYLAGRQG
jgi:two-component system nitrate/nitrite response regulator NarL